MFTVYLKNKKNIEKEIRFRLEKNNKKKTFTFYPILMDNKTINSKSYLTIWGWNRFTYIEYELQFVHYIKNLVKKLDGNFGKFDIVSVYSTDHYDKYYDYLTIHN